MPITSLRWTAGASPFVRAKCRDVTAHSRFHAGLTEERTRPVSKGDFLSRTVHAIFVALKLQSIAALLLIFQTCLKNLMQFCRDI